MFTQLGVMIHIPQQSRCTTLELLSRLHTMLRLCGESFPSQAGTWRVVSDACDGMQVYDFSSFDEQSWQRWIAKYQDAICFVSGEVVLSTAKKKRSMVTFSATISRSNRYTVPIIDEERVIWIQIPKAVWDRIKQEDFLKGVQHACYALEAAYACVDDVTIAAKTIYTGGFRYFGVNSHKIPPQTRLPGIYWAQYVTQEMVRETGTLQEIENEAPCEVKGMVGENQGIWLQLTHDFLKTQREDRLALRKYFSESLYQLSLLDIAKSVRIDLIPVIDYLPLDVAEITEIERIRNNTREKEM